MMVESSVCAGHALPFPACGHAVVTINSGCNSLSGSSESSWNRLIKFCYKINLHQAKRKPKIFRKLLSQSGCPEATTLVQPAFQPFPSTAFNPFDPLQKFLFFIFLN